MRGAVGLAAILGVALFVVAGTSASDTGARSGPGPAEFVRVVDNQWFPLRPGTVFVYRGVKDGEPTRDVVRVTTGTRMIQGIRCTGASDRLYSAGRLSERTTDWYAQDREGTLVFGEETAELLPLREGHEPRRAHGLRVSTGARAGIFMPARPSAGQAFRQEFLKGHAEDHFERAQPPCSLPAFPPSGPTARCSTREWTPLEPGVVDHKLDVRGVGLVDERTIRPATQRNTLVRWTR